MKKKRQSPKARAARKPRRPARAGAKPAAKERRAPLQKPKSKRAKKITSASPMPGPTQRSDSASEANRELPFSYDKTKLALLARDPEWAFTYWDFSAETWDWLQDLFADDDSLTPKLRVHNLSESSHYDVDVLLEAKNWYLRLRPATSYEVELGLLSGSGRFISIVRSNRITMPRSGPSSVIDPKWNADYSEALCRAGSGHGGGSGGSSGGGSSSPMRRPPSSIPTNVFS